MHEYGVNECRRCEHHYRYYERYVVCICAEYAEQDDPRAYYNGDAHAAEHA